MSDTTKTIAFVGTAAAIALIAFVTTPARVTTSDQQRVGKSLFPELEKVGALDIKGLEIVQIQEDTGKPRTFKVKQVKGRWVLPDHENYPADAVKHLAAAVKDVRGLKIDDVAGDAKGDHQQFGVIEPTLGEQKATTGVGTLVTVFGDNDRTLARLIVGKTSGKNGNLRYARVAGQDMVYLVDIKTDNWSTKFEDWVESKLLNLEPWDLRQLELRDYTAEPVISQNGSFGTRKTRRSDIELDFDADKSTWNVASLTEFDGEKAAEAKLADGEQVNATKINEVKSALSDLKIIDAEAKPVEMTSDLIAFFQAAEAKGRGQGFQSLVERGFFPHEAKDGGLALDALEGELVCRMKDGVEYVLRFGEIAGATDAAKRKDAKDDDKPAEKDKKDAKADADKKPGSQISRYVWVMAQVNEALIPKPKLEPLPEETKPEEKKAEGGKADEKKADAAKDPAAAKTADDKKAADKKAADKDDKTDEPKKDEAKKEDPQAVERLRIEGENKRKQADYDDKLSKAQDRVTELNRRFGNWYYVIADDEYKKIHLSRADVIQKKEKPKGQGDGVEDFNELQKNLKGVPAIPSPEK